MLGKKHIAPGILAAYMDRELPPEKAAAVEAHLDVCNRCYQRALRQGKTAELVRNAFQADATAPVKPSIAPVSLIARSLQRLPKTPYRPGFVVVLVALALTFLLVYGIQSLVTDVLARDINNRNDRVATFVEDHLTYENVYRATSR